MSNLAQSIIDKAMDTAGGDKATAQSLLKIFFEEVTQFKTEFERLIANKDLQTIAMLAHKLAGACAYFGAAELRMLLLDAEKKAKQASIEEVEAMYQNIMDHIQAVTLVQTQVLTALLP